jgi:hypothetical protein
MWVRFGRWMELGVHFGRQNTRVDVLDRYLVHAAVRFGQKEWTRGPRRQEISRHPSMVPGRPGSPCLPLYPDPEPLRWGIKKIVSGVGVTHSAVNTNHAAC